MAPVSPRKLLHRRIPRRYRRVAATSRSSRELTEKTLKTFGGQLETTCQRRARTPEPRNVPRAGANILENPGQSSEREGIHSTDLRVLTISDAQFDFFETNDNLSNGVQVFFCSKNRKLPCFDARSSGETETRRSIRRISRRQIAACTSLPPDCRREACLAIDYRV